MIDLYKGDCRDVLKDLIEKGTKVDCVLTSPPYDDIKNYNNTNSWNFDVFQEVAKQLFEILVDGGVIIWVVADKTENGSESGTSFKQALYFKEIGFNIHDTMIYRKLNYVPLTHNRYEQEFEYMFCFSKGKPKTFNPIKVPCKYAGTSTWGKSSFYKTDDDELVKTESHKKINDTKIKGNVFEYHTGSLTNSKEYQHPAMFPYDLANDQIITWTNKDDIVLDPFMGAGTTGLVCRNTSRNFIGIEIVDKYYDMCKKRLILKKGLI